MEEQMNMLPEIDYHEKMTERMRVAQIRDKLDKEYTRPYLLYGYNPDNMPNGLVVIIETELDRKRHFYRCVIGYHRTVSGLMAHIISEPNEEWDDKPLWHYDTERKIQWTYPGGYNHQIYCHKEPQFEEPKWTEA